MRASAPGAGWQQQRQAAAAAASPCIAQSSRFLLLHRDEPAGGARVGGVAALRLSDELLAACTASKAILLVLTATQGDALHSSSLLCVLPFFGRCPPQAHQCYRTDPDGGRAGRASGSLEKAKAGSLGNRCVCVRALRMPLCHTVQAYQHRGCHAARYPPGFMTLAVPKPGAPEDAPHPARHGQHSAQVGGEAHAGALRAEQHSAVAGAAGH